MKRTIMHLCEVSKSKLGDKNPMKNPETAKRVHDKTRGRHWYHNPINYLDRGQFFDGTEPKGWVKGMK